MADPEPRQIDWASAQVEGGALSVELTGRASKSWSARFERTLALLDSQHGNWGKVQLDKRRIKVDGLQPGAEEELHHFLESVALQVNSDTQPETTGRRAEADGDRGDPDPDDQMTATFRTFATHEED
jgi:hypothetical protein